LRIDRLKLTYAIGTLVLHGNYKKKSFLQLLNCISKTLIKNTEQVFNSRFLQLLAEYKKKLYEKYIKQCIGTDFDSGFVFKPMHLEHLFLLYCN